MTDGASFLPRIESVFYATFDVLQGPKVVHQVPEGLIAVSTQSTGVASSQVSSNGLLSPSPVSPPPRDGDPPLSRAPSVAIATPPILQRVDSRSTRSPFKRADSTNQFLFNFDDVSKYIIPPSALCGRLVICATRRHRIIGFPMEIRGKYERNYFRYNLCFVFERSADLSCYKPVVRKVSRVLKSCEEESAFLSNVANSPSVYAILEQLYEDLNSYSETSIEIDQFNSIELKIFPFYPNPPQVKDWQVPLALINITRRVESNWDLTMVKVCQYIDGTNHVARIAQLAECDLDLTREAISHLLFYQVIMMIDIFQYSNVYVTRKSLQWLADAHHVKEECGPYVTKSGREVPHWPRLLHLYSRFKPGKTVLEWMEEHDVLNVGVDVRRFTSFGVVKGFLRRVHRWPVLLPDPDQTPPPKLENSHFATMPSRQRGFSTLSLRPEPDQTKIRGRPQEALPTITSAGAELTPAKPTDAPFQPIRRTSAAETSLEQLRNREVQKSGGDWAPGPRASRLLRSGSTTSRDPVRNSISDLNTLNPLHSSPRINSLRLSPDPLSGNHDVAESGDSSGKSTIGATRPKLARSPSAPPSNLHHTASPFPPALLELLDGEHHTDELCTRFNVGWSLLEQWLVMAGQGQGNGDFGNVCIIYR